ncbi:MAG: bifunctional transaldolase/phosoglucose isomerase, partial [Anaerolineae bacterium]
MKTLSELAYLGAHRDGLAETLAGMKEARMLPRIWDRDHTVWRPEPEEITNRLGWLDIAERVGADLRRFQTLRDTLLDEGYTDVLLLGMGGSSLAPDLFGTVFASEDPALQLEVLDSTDPGAVLEHARRLDLRRTLFIVASKSGTTAE